jgi:peptidoglycan/LPS O-acetylase OafA/YrhL
MSTARLEPISIPLSRQMPEPFHLGYRPALDGVRAFAVLAVIGHHAYIPFCTGGAIGVDIFFVLSGFLITSLLLEEWRSTGRISLPRFYLRRVLRLIPALAVVLIAIELYSVVVFHGPRFWQMQRAVASVVFYVGNWMEAFHLVDLGALSHTWSLSIEEQFYLLWPLTFLVLLRSKVKEAAIVRLLGLMIAVIAVRRYFMWTGSSSGDRIYFGADTRFDELLAGCALGIWIHLPIFPRERMRLLAAYLVGPAVLGIVVFTVHELRTKTLYRLGWPVIEVAVGIVILALLLGSAGPLQKVLEWRPAVWIGKISYGLYLWHFPILTKTESAYYLGPLRNYVGIALTFAVAAASYYFLELRFLRRKQRLAPV